MNLLRRKNGEGALPFRPSTMVLIAAVASVASLPLILLCASGGCTESVIQTPTPKREITFKGQPRVRVLLADHTHGGVAMPVKVTGGYRLMDATTSEILVRGAWLQSAWGTVIQGLSNGVVVNVPSDVKGRTKTMHVPRVRIMPDRSGTLFVGARAYRGVLDIIYNRDGTMTLVNEVDMDDYVGGVVTAEMFYYWPMEALKAQAIVARTYTLALKMEKERESPRPEWDVESGYLTNQEYQGVTGEHPRGLEAAQATAGLVLAWQGNVFRTYFHSCCGGHTEACGLVWDDYRTIPPLAGTVCDYCKLSKHWEWKEQLRLVDVERTLRRVDRDVGDIRELAFKDANNDGHIDGITVIGTRQSIEMKGNEFRLAVGPTVLKSMHFTAKRADGAYELTGRGWGHGVGMCQYGAKGMADLLMNHERILKYYYPEIELYKAY